MLEIPLSKKRKITPPSASNNKKLLTLASERWQQGNTGPGIDLQGENINKLR